MTLSISSETLKQYVGDSSFQARACKGLDLNIFFPEFDITEKRSDRKEEIDDVVNICEGCPIKEECLDWALSHGEKNGIWGGVYLDEYYKRFRRYRN